MIHLATFSKALHKCMPQMFFYTRISKLGGSLDELRVGLDSALP